MHQGSCSHPQNKNRGWLEAGGSALGEGGLLKGISVVLLPAQTISLSGASPTCWAVLGVGTDPDQS